LIEGDGIGPEITAATVRALEAAGGQLDWDRVDAGASAVARHGDPLPAATIESIKRTGLVLKAPLALFRRKSNPKCGSAFVPEILIGNSVPAPCL
jgi:isocitrate/isopropylmalate dehydrogenase